MFKTEQESFWAGKFGTDYVRRNNNEKYVSSNMAFFSKALSKISYPNSIIEFGANIGLNIRALKLLFPDSKLNAIEINKDAVKELNKVLNTDNIFNGSILDYKSHEKFDVVLIKGVLIHINPEYLNDAYQKLYDSCKKYLLIGEYYNPTPISIPYRGHNDCLFKRDFAGEILERFPNMRLIDYGFAYHKDPIFPQDDITWFLLEKNA